MKYIKTENFNIKFDEPTTFGFTAITSNYFLREILNKRKDKKSTNLYFRLFRTGIIGDILFKAGQERVIKKSEAKNQFLAVLFESYLFLIRSIYDHLLHYLKEKYGIKDSSFSNFIKKIGKGGYPELEGKLRKHLLGTNFFDEIRSLRDSIKRQTPSVDIYVKNHKYYVSGTIYRRDGSKEFFDEPLSKKMLTYSIALLLIMAYVAESITGVTLKEQLNYHKEHSVE